MKPQNKNASTQVTQKVIRTVEPHLQLHHSSDQWKAIWWMEDYNQLLKFLYELFFEKQQSASVKGRKPFYRSDIFSSKI